MGILSSSISITRYQVNGKLEEPVTDAVLSGLKAHAIPEIEDTVSDKVLGWTSFENPYTPKFEGSSFVIGPFFVFSLRIDKKNIPSKMVRKELDQAIAKKLADENRNYLSKTEKRALKDEIIHRLSSRIPATPNSYDLIWHYEDAYLWFFSNLKSANEELEALFSTSFGLMLVRLFPYTQAHLESQLTDSEKDMIKKLTPSRFSE